MAKKQGLSGLRPKVISIAVASCFVTSTVLANPTAPTVVHGTATFNQAGNLLQITNSPSAIINWQSFSIGANEITRFIQQSQSSSVLNRVTGAAGVIDPSVILGALQSNGRVFLINPSGILFGAGAQVDVAGLVASSLNLSNADFLANRLKFSEVAGAGSVANQGNITTGSGGNVYLVGSAVTNNGIITSPQGEVVLAAGNSVELVSPGTPNLRVEVNAPDNEARNLGQIIADSGRAGIYAGLINNSGTIRASSAVAEGGKILLKGTKAVTLESTSILDASGVGGGTIEVLSKNGGTVKVAGRLDASAPVSGNGGFIETSADNVSVAGGTVVTTSATQGKAGLWLIDPTDFTISAGYGGQNVSGIGAATLSSSLNSGNVTIATSAVDNSQPGDIFVEAPVSWSSGNSLSLVAHRDVNVNNSITSTFYGGSVSLYAGWNGVDPNSPTVTPGVGTINVNAPISMSASASGFNQQVTLAAGKDILVNNSISASAYGGLAGVFLSAGNDIKLNESSVTALSTACCSGTAVVNLFADRDIVLDGGSTVSAHASAQSFVDLAAENTLTIQGGSSVSASASSDAEVLLFGLNGITVDNSSISANSSSSDAYIELIADGATAEIKIIDSSISASAGNSASVILGAEGGAGKIKVENSSITANADNDHAIVSLFAGSGGITVDGGEGGITASSSQSNANVMMLTSGTIKIGTTTTGATIHADGAEGALVDMVALGNIEVKGSTIEAISSDSSNTAYVALLAGGDVTVTDSAIHAYSPASSAEALVGIQAGGSITIDNSEVTAYVSNSFGSAFVGMQAGGSITITNNSSVEAYADGGEGRAVVGLMAGVDITLGAGSEVAAKTGAVANGPTLVGMVAGNNITLGGNVASVGIDGGEGWLSPFDLPSSVLALLPGGLDSHFTGVAMQAGNKIVGGAGVLSAYYNGDNANQAIALRAANGIGTIATPVRIQDGSENSGPDIFLHNTASGDIAVSFVANGLQIYGDLEGVRNDNPGGTYFIQTETGSIELGIPFLPDGSPLLNGQSVIFKALAGDVLFQAGDETIAGIATTGGGSATAIGQNVTINNGNISGIFNATATTGNVTQSGGFVSALFNATATAGSVNLSQSGDYTLGLLQAPAGTVSVFTSGAILDGNSGMNVVAPIASLFGSGGIGADNHLETQVNSITLAAYGGGIGVVNHGNMTLSGLMLGGSNTAEIQASTQFGAPTATLTVSSISTSGNVFLVGDTNVAVTGSVFTGGNLTVLSGTGDILVSGSGSLGTSTGTLLIDAGHDYLHSSSSVLSSSSGGINVSAINDVIFTAGGINSSYGGTIAVGAGHDVTATGGAFNTPGVLSMAAGNNLNITGVSVSGNTVGLGAAGAVNITGEANVNAATDMGIGGGIVSINGSSASAGNLMTVSAGTLNVANGGTLSGFDVDLTIDTLISLSNGGKIVAGAPQTIDILFPTLASGGFLVNAVAGVVDPEDSGTGFFVPAGHVDNLVFPGFTVTYGSGELPPAVQQAINQTVNSTNQQTNVNEQDKEPETNTSGTGGPEGDKDKKDLPVCK